jgi:hypothetical protein
MVCMHVLVNSRFTENPSTWSWLTSSFHDGGVTGTDHPDRSIPPALESGRSVPTAQSLAADTHNLERGSTLWLVHVFSLNSKITVWIKKLVVFTIWSQKIQKKIPSSAPSFSSSHSHTNSFPLTHTQNVFMELNWYGGANHHGSFRRQGANHEHSRSGGG